MNYSGWLKRYGWMLLLPGFFLIYATSFNRFDILEKKHSVLAEADTAAFNMLIQDFDLSKKYGDEYNLGDRQLGDVAQKHKIHHTLYFLVAGGLGKFLGQVTDAFGIPRKQILYSVNAILSCVNIGLLYLLLRSLSPTGRSPVLFVVLYGFSLSTWVYSSVTESWILSVTMLLLFLLAYTKRRDSVLFLSAVVGIAMTNNIWLCTLFMFVLVQLAATSSRMTDFLKKTAAGGAVAILSWALIMSLFALYDESISPINYVKYTWWFKEHIAPPIIMSQSYYWKSSFTNVLINSVLSNQPDPYIPQEALLLTLKGSVLGVVASVLYLGMLLLTFRGLVMDQRLKYRDPDSIKAIFGEQTVQIFIFILLWIIMPVILDTSGAFLHSTLVTPMMVVLIHRYFPSDGRWSAVLLYGGISMVIINNVDQILQFREALGKLH